MSKTVTLGGDRLGAGKRQKVTLHGFERSNHDMGFTWRSTMSPGTLVPFMSELALPGDTFDITLNMDGKTHPTVGPLFGSYKAQLDVFQCPIRLYQGQLHNNKLGIGMNMSQIKLPQMTLFVDQNVDPNADGVDIDNMQINPSCLLSYLDIRGVGISNTVEDGVIGRDFQALKLLSYWDIYKQYYSNKQEPMGAMIFNDNVTLRNTVTSIVATPLPGGTTGIVGTDPVIMQSGGFLTVNYTGLQPIGWQIIFDTGKGELSLEEIAFMTVDNGTEQIWQYKYGQWGNLRLTSWRYITPGEMPAAVPTVRPFALVSIDNMRESILAQTKFAVPFIVNDFATADDPYGLLLNWVDAQSTYLFSQQGLGLKTYQSDLFNNWLSTEWIDGAQGINEITKVDTSSGSFTMDALLLSKKVYDMLNRIAVSGGTYDDWLDAVYDEDRFTRAESPIYHGGLIKELVFQEVVSNSAAASGGGGNVGDTQPLGTLGGRGVMASKHKGGRITIKVTEPSYIMGIVSLTPRVDYSQGNKWDTHLETMDDLHKPGLDEIGFQELITEQMAWFDTTWNGTAWVQKSAGKQPAWTNYMTAINVTRGNFAIKDNEMFMTLNRRYEWRDGQLADVTTYIDPVKYNHIFADTAIDAQNFWVQISVDNNARRKMSARVMPNL